MLKQIIIENQQGISTNIVLNSVTKILPQAEIELQKRCNRIKTFHVSNYEINIKYEKEKITFFVSRKRQK